MSWITKILGADKLVGAIGGIVDSLHTSEDEKNAAKLAMEKLIQAREAEVEETIRAELLAKERVLVAELQQGDSYTKRARPTVVYFGLAAIFLNYVLPNYVPTVTTVTLPTEFWVAWGGIVATWSIGRTAEKRGVRNQVVQGITGSKLLN
jgi:hypothetical protein